MSYRSLSFMPTFNDNSIFSDRFNQIDKMFSTLTGEKPISEAPVYNFYQKNETCYQLELSIPGYDKKELDISVHNSQLSIKGNKKTEEIEKNKQIKWIHKGFKTDNFSINFNLEYKIKVQKAELLLGILKVDFECYIPEDEKPKKISILTSDDSKIIENK